MTDEKIQEPIFVPLLNEHYSIPSTYGNPIDLISQQELTQGLDCAISELTERNQKVLKMRFYDKNSLQETAKNLGEKITRERIRQIEAISIGKLRRKAKTSPKLKEIARGLGMAADFSNLMQYTCI